MSTARKQTFRRYGRAYHLLITTAEDLESIFELDEAHWVATNAPINTINCDSVLLNLVDSDDNDRITCQEMKEAIGWLLEVLKDYEGVNEKSGRLRLAAINTDTPPGRQSRTAAAKILSRLGKSQDDEITLQQVRQIKAQVEAMPVSEAGVVLPQAADDDDIKGFLADISATTGGTPHPSGVSGVGSDQLDKFLADAAAYLNWHEQGVIPAGSDKTEIMPFGSDTPAAFAILESLRGKIDQYFAQCEALALDERFVQRMGWTEAELEGVDFDDPAVIEGVLKKAPLAKASPTRSLSLTDPVNPYYAATLENFSRDVAAPVLGDCGTTLSALQWNEIKSFFAAHQSWGQANPNTPVEQLGLAQLRTYLDDKYAHTVRDLIAESAQTAFVLDNIRLLEKLILYQGHLIDLTNNFISFPHLYDPASRAMFELGTLVMDGRKFNLAVKVENRTQHAAIAKTSNMFVLYVEVVPPGGAPKFEVAVPVTSGGKGNLCLGKRGAFCDLKDNIYDAKVVHIIENPISYREALVSPFQRIGRLLTGKIESITTDAEKKLDKQVALPTAAAKPAATQNPGMLSGGMLVGGGVALAALSSALAYITATLADVEPIRIIAGILGAVLLVLLPISIVAFLKLRRRDLSAILEGSGWGVNSRMRLTSKQSRFFTERPKYPPGAKGIRRLGPRLAIIIVLVIAVLGCGGYLFHRYNRPTPPATEPPPATTPTDEAPDKSPVPEI